MSQILKQVSYAELKGIKPCACGCENLIVWEPSLDPQDRDTPEKIECTRCGATVWGSGDDEIESWNAGEYDEPGRVEE